MIKTLFCILSLALLLLGVGREAGKDMQGFREDIGIPEYSASLASSSSETLFSESSENFTFGILSALSIPKTSTPVKTLKFNDVSTILQLLSLQESKLPASRWKNLFAETNSLKYSNRYYIYALAHILI